MGVYSRFKKEPDGLRHLVELLESTPLGRRQRMIEVGMREDAAYTQKALLYVFSFEDILNLSDVELSDVVAETPPKLVGYAIHSLSEDLKVRVLSKAHVQSIAEIREALAEENISPAQISTA